jgi:hypothetical protein
MVKMHFAIFLMCEQWWKVDCNNPQMVHCILSYNSPINASNFKTYVRKNLISYYKTNGIITFNKHVNANHAIIAKEVGRGQ